ncbi:MAG: SDR family NAD(P)-dependent oxidoreductase [Gammaproteobacteria bacterium]|nr:SDR family NAD(P)-dependent oxidoreductase [Gammaproteobacteria bacterium]
MADESPKTALVFGASGTLGRALCHALSQRSSIDLLIGTGRYRDRIPSECEPVVLDAADPAGVQAACAEIRQLTDRLDLVIYCIGVLHDSDHGIHPEKRLEQVDAETMSRQFAVNATAPLLLARELSALLPRRDRCIWAHLSARVGSIGDNHLGGWYSYRASKAAQNMITRTLAIELGRRHRGLACVALHPGTVASPLSAPFRSSEATGVMTPEASVSHLLAVMDGLDAGSSGHFFAWDGSEIPW